MISKSVGRRVFLSLGSIRWPWSVFVQLYIGCAAPAVIDGYRWLSLPHLLDSSRLNRFFRRALDESGFRASFEFTSCLVYRQEIRLVSFFLFFSYFMPYSRRTPNRNVLLKRFWSSGPLLLIGLYCHNKYSPVPHVSRVCCSGARLPPRLFSGFSGFPPSLRLYTDY